MKVALDTTKKKEGLKSIYAATRDAALEAGFIYQEEAYPCDPVFQEAIKTFLSAYTNGILLETETVKVRRTDNTFWYPDRAQLLPFAGALMFHVQTIWDNYWSAKDLI